MYRHILHAPQHNWMFCQQDMLTTIGEVCVCTVNFSVADLQTSTNKYYRYSVTPYSQKKQQHMTHQCHMLIEETSLALLYTGIFSVHQMFYCAIFQHLQVETQTC